MRGGVGVGVGLRDLMLVGKLGICVAPGGNRNFFLANVAG
jgi:hypothetical protein